MDVVCGTDLSTEAKKAAEIAGAIAKRTGGRLVLGMALQVPAMAFVAGDVVLFPSTAGTIDAVRTDANIALETEGRRVSSLLGVPTTSVLDIGSADEVILSTAAREKAALIVVGTHGHRAPVRWLLGSTAERVTSLSPIPVLVTRGESAAILGWAKQERPLRVLIAADFEESFAPAARFAMSLLGRERVEVHVAHAFELPLADAGRYPFAPAFPMRRVDLEGNAARELRRHAKAAGLDSRAETIHLVWGKPASAIAAFAREGRFDLVVMGTHGRRGIERALLGSVAHGILRRAACPVLVVPMGS